MPPQVEAHLAEGCEAEARRVVVHQVETTELLSAVAHPVPGVGRVAKVDGEPGDVKRELLAGRSAFPDQATAYRAVFRWANRYNTRRRHSAIGNISPNAYEAARSATLAEAA
ncbi:integrase core domain-containing protein [Pseudarthrobacter phenanthrenivorans]|uniref:integrase core domain-containing protein n=1 Tax=Pseudarthrobacter phenanthrenivorans TaxID=361575 RepID=UPI00142EB396|nr:integrase core domain-containing protein [Pseudarthrobacter phenanthrenivorans]